MRLKLKMFRVGQNLTQAEMAEKIGCSLTSYQAIESCRRNGSVPFMQKLQKAFGLTGNEVMDLMEETDEASRKESNSPTN